MSRPSFTKGILRSLTIVYKVCTDSPVYCAVSRIVIGRLTIPVPTEASVTAKNICNLPSEGLNQRVKGWQWQIAALLHVLLPLC